MKIERLSSLLASLYNNNAATTSEKKGTETATSQNEDAVRVSKSLPRSSTEQSRAEKVAEVRARVESKQYVVDSEKVATALLRDLF